MPHDQVTIAAHDGDCPAHVFTPGGGQGGPAVIFYMDAGGIRPTMLDMAQRLADAGYVNTIEDSSPPRRATVSSVRITDARRLAISRQRITSGVTMEVVDRLEVVEVMVAQEATEI